mmetsp:Transcript_14524/g.42542  ORF Transcript_14524/g.42542 Transcript_14524/m.42542 type:complete len:271 (+) Transcript_14524:1947-2759(+)
MSLGTGAEPHLGNVEGESLAGRAEDGVNGRMRTVKETGLIQGRVDRFSRSCGGRRRCGHGRGRGVCRGRWPSVLPWLAQRRQGGAGQFALSHASAGHFVVRRHAEPPLAAVASSHASAPAPFTPASRILILILIIVVRRKGSHGGRAPGGRGRGQLTLSAAAPSFRYGRKRRSDGGRLAHYRVGGAHLPAARLLLGRRGVVAVVVVGATVADGRGERTGRMMHYFLALPAVVEAAPVGLSVVAVAVIAVIVAVGARGGARARARAAPAQA